MVTFGVAYWGRCVATAERDVARLRAAGFSWVVLPVSSERMAFDRPATARVVAAAKAAGLTAWVSPWGPPFGGEGIAPADKSPLRAAADWLADALGLDPDGVYFDEPLGVRGPQAVEALLPACPLPMRLYANERVGVLPSRAVLDRMESVGVDYYDGNPFALEERLDRVGRSRPRHVWTRAFGLPPARSIEPAVNIGFLARSGVADIGVWGYPSPGVSCLNNAEPERVWALVEEAVAEVLAAGVAG